VPTHSTIRSQSDYPNMAHPISFLVETPEDGVIWREIDCREDNRDLNGSRLTQTFAVAGVSHSGPFGRSIWQITTSEMITCAYLPSISFYELSRRKRERSIRPRLLCVVISAHCFLDSPLQVVRSSSSLLLPGGSRRAGSRKEHEDRHLDAV
jgi:hypothetical protein